jgi:hypothetical protein
MSNINWQIVEEKMNAERTPVSLSETEMEREYPFTFTKVFQSESGSIGAEVEVEDLEGDLLWLFSEEYGPTNGFLSLRKAVGDLAKLEGSTITYVRIASDKSPVGYAHSWRV